MKRKTILKSLIAVLLISSAFVPSSKPKTKWSNELKRDKGSNLRDIFAKDATGFYTLNVLSKKFGKSEISVNRYTYNLAEKSGEPFDLTYGKKDRSFESLIDFAGEFRLFSSFTNTKDKNAYLFVETIDKKTLKSKKDVNKVTEVDFDVKRGKRQLGSSTFQFFTSRDSSNLLIFSNLPTEKKANELIGCTVLNNEMKVLWNNIIEIPYPDHLFSIKDYSISSKGDLYVLGKLYEEKGSDIKRKQINFKYQIIGYKNFGKEKVIYDVELSDKFITDMKITINNDDDIICAGFFSNELEYNVDGTYFLKIDGSSKKIMSSNTKEFDKGFLLENLSEKQEKKANKKLDKGKDVDVRDFDIRNLIVRKDGGVVMIGEQYRMVVVTTTTRGANGQTTTTTTYHYYYDEVLVVNISPEGSIDWYARIPKHQHTINDNGKYSSFALMVQEDKLNFFYNDHPDNISLDDSKGRFAVWSKRPKNTVVMYTTIDNTGKMVRTPMINAKDAEIMTKPNVCEQISAHQFVMYGEKDKKTHKFAIVTP